MANPPSKFFKDFNATNITVTNSSTNSGADTNNAPANISIPTPSTTPPPAYNLGMPPPGTFYNPYDRPMGNPPGLQQPYTHSAYRVQNALGLVPAVQYGPPISAGPRFNNVSPQVEVDEDDDVSDAKTIKILINCPISVKGNNNNVMVSPVVGVGKVVAAVVQAIREASMCQGGIPMIDEDGVPRGVDVQVEAGMTIDGDGNVVGEVGSFGDDEQNTRLLGRDVVAQATMEDRVAIKRARDDESDSTVVAGPQRRSKKTRRP